MTDTLGAIREQVSQYRGSRVFYRAANGRRKAEARQGIIMEAYPSLFTLFVESQNSTVSFSYADLLTKEVELKLLPGLPEDEKTR
ncbi:MAG: Veg family protein [Synergistaceae bacterium]|nr:Veg family protein [Synergistaceae bacterium]